MRPAGYLWSAGLQVHGVTSRKNVIYVRSAVRTSNAHKALNIFFGGGGHRTTEFTGSAQFEVTSDSSQLAFCRRPQLLQLRPRCSYQLLATVVASCTIRGLSEQLRLPRRLHLQYGEVGRWLHTAAVSGFL